MLPECTAATLEVRVYSRTPWAGAHADTGRPNQICLWRDPTRTCVGSFVFPLDSQVLQILYELCSSREAASVRAFTVMVSALNLDEGIQSKHARISFMKSMCFWGALERALFSLRFFHPGTSIENVPGPHIGLITCPRSLELLLQISPGKEKAIFGIHLPINPSF